MFLLFSKLKTLKYLLSLFKSPFLKNTASETNFKFIISTAFVHMGTSGNWLKSLITLKKPPTSDQNDKMGEKSKKKWSLWRSSSEGFGSSIKLRKKRGQVAASESSVSSYVLDDAFAAAMATIIRAPPKDFKLVKQEWASIRIQTVFRGFLARRAFRALKAVVRIQAIFRGRQVRKQAAVTLKCMQALVRVQARVRANSVRISPEDQAVDEPHRQMDPLKQAEQGWCDSPGTVNEVRAKLHMRQKAAIKRERVLAYSLSQQRVGPNGSPNIRNKPAMSVKKNQRLNENNSPKWNWLDSWMAAKPWESRLMEEEIHSVPSEMTHLSKKSEGYSCSSEQDSVQVRNNHVTTRISATPSRVNQTNGSSSAPSCELYDENSESTSSTNASPNLAFGNKNLKGEKVDDFNQSKQSYMNITQSVKAKQRAYRFPSPNRQSYLMEECQSYENKSMTLSSVDSNISGYLSKSLYPPMQKSRQDCQRGRRK